MNKESFKNLLEKQIKDGNEILISFLIPIASFSGNYLAEISKYNLYKTKFENWECANIKFLKSSFTNEDNEYVKRYGNTVVFPTKTKSSINYTVYSSHFKTEIKKKLQNLEQIKNLIPFIKESEFDSENFIENVNLNQQRMKRIFISHSHKDETIVKKIVLIMESLGLGKNEIFCSSIKGYGVPLGNDFIEKIKTELNNDTLVVSILTKNYYKSPISLCEMGAAWIKSKEFIPIIVPPFKRSSIKGIFPSSIVAMTINNKEDLNELKEKLEIVFNLNKIVGNRWEDIRDDIIADINAIINN